MATQQAQVTETQWMDVIDRITQLSDIIDQLTSGIEEMALTMDTPEAEHVRVCAAELLKQMQLRRP